MEKFHEYDVQGDEEWERFYLGIRTDKEEDCPQEKPIVIDHVKANDIKINTVKCKSKYWIDPSGDGVGPDKPSCASQWVVPGEVEEGEAEVSIIPEDV
eukprot:12310870-Prorocentrum_lima.AAC.1